MRISDWSSDVCSSDLLPQRPRRLPRAGALDPAAIVQAKDVESVLHRDRLGNLPGLHVGQRPLEARIELAFLHAAEFAAVGGARGLGELLGEGAEGRAGRSEQRRVGKAGVRTCRYGWAQ